MTVLSTNTTDEYQSFDSLTCFADSDFAPYVRYAEGGGSDRQPVLRPVTSPIGEVNTVGPVYWLTDGQIGRLESLATNPHAVRGEAPNIATELQNECEAAGRVLYPLYVESDNLNDEHRSEEAHV